MIRKLVRTILPISLAFAKASFAEPIDLCMDFATVLEKQIGPELNTGIQKNLALAIRRNEQISISQPLTLKKDLWKNQFVLETANKKTSADKLETLQSEICTYFKARIAEMKIQKGDQFILVLNPNTEAISHIMEDWTEKHVGLYKNMGLRVRWNSMSELQKSQKTFLLKTVGENP